MKGKYTTIFLSIAALTLPLTLILAIFLGLIFAFRVQHSNSASDALRSPATTDTPGYIFVDLNPTYLMRVGSFISLVASKLVVFAVTLAMFPLAAALLDSSQPGGEPSKLLTPYQLLLTLQLSSNGSILSIWDWIHYRRKHAASVTPISRPVSNIAKTAAAATFLG